MIEIYEDFDRKINVRRKYRTLIQSIQSFIKSYLDFIRLNDVFDFDDDIFLNEFFEKLIKRFKNLYDIREGFITLC